MIARLRPMFSGPHAWLVLGLLLSRATGFLIGLVLARSAGASALGLYSTVMNTAAPLVSPISHAMINNNTLMASEQRDSGLRSLWRAQLAITLIALAVTLPLFAWLFGRAVGHDMLEAAQWGWALVGAGSVVLSQLGTPMVAALLHGEGRFRAAGQWSVLTGAVGLAAVVPVVWAFGLAGALGLAAASAMLGWLLLSADVLRRHRREPAAAPVRGPILARLRTALPAITGMGLNGGVNWLCTIYLVHAHWRAEGVGVLGVGLQWSTLILIPATSWGGMTLSLIGQAHRSGDRAVLTDALRRQLLRNGSATLVAALAVVAGAGLLADLYRLQGRGLPLVLCAFAAAAFVGSLNNVFERLWWAAGRQRSWFAWQCVAFVMQIGTTLWLLPHHVAFAGLGVLVAGLTLSLCSLLGLRAHLRDMREGSA